MRYIKYLVACCATGLLIGTARAQELNCNVIINDAQVQTQERQIIEQLRKNITQFMNTTRWTNDDFKTEERIKCTFFITLEEKSNVTEGQYLATVQVQAVRPVYGTNYETTLLNFFDRKFSFEYTPSQPLIFTENSYTTNLTSMLAFYAYTILALDYDSFANKGGNPFYERMINIVSNAQQSASQGWDNGDTRNRYFLSENLNNSQAQPMREAWYAYHRLALDNFKADTKAAQEKVITLLEKLRDFNQTNPTAVWVNAFFDAKSSELQGIFSQGDPEIIKKAVDLLVRLDPQKAPDYQKLLKQ